MLFDWTIPYTARRHGRHALQSAAIHGQDRVRLVTSLQGLRCFLELQFRDAYEKNDSFASNICCFMECVLDELWHSNLREILHRAMNLLALFQCFMDL